MKRSELIEKCVEEFYWSFYYETSFDKHLVDSLLTFFEKQGMLPPKYYKDVNDFAMSYCDNPSELIEVYAINEWEPEDEN